ncbi:hypothetical protein Pmani_027688 [Petrolisthes manimaculis]|uniref:Protein transport protein SEC23 n=1 Tax=Petrolisthes manimaculis TaxID=1843537 RepID=A0AAE1P3N5_9EUCA|nr:hypothetical protein Pmani_027688 [Petrolisthes manimaculis]
MNENHKPAELYPKYNTIEYTLSNQQQQQQLGNISRTTSATGYTAPRDGNNGQLNLPPVFLFVVDTQVDMEELTAIKESISMSLSILPPQALVGLITFDRDVTIYVMVNTLLIDTYIFHGLTAPSTKTIQRHLQVELLMTGMTQTYGQVTPSPTGNKFLRPLIECEMYLQEILLGLEPKNRPVHKDKRPLRASGTALSIAISLLELCYPKNTGSGRVFTFLGGPCSYGPGMVVDDDLINSIRSHHDIDTNNCPYLKKTTRFYENLAKSACGNGHVVDLFACSVNQVGLYEMKSFAKYTGGHMVMCEAFNSPQFITSYQRLFSLDEQGNLEMAFNATVEVKTSRELKVDNVLSPFVSCNESSHIVAGFELNDKYINMLTIPCLTPRTNIYMNFEVVASEPSTNQDNKCYIQFITHYQQLSGSPKVRVTTVSRGMADPQRENGIVLRYFDQETAAVLTARMALDKSEEAFIDESDVLRYVDRKLIRLSERFAIFSNNDRETCVFQDSFSLYPQFMFHFRRSQFIQLFNNSPDQTTFYKCMLNRENVTECLTMIQPVLRRYSISSTEAVLLDTLSIQPDCLLLLDTYFVVLIYSGKTIVAWKEEKYHERNEYAHIKELLNRPIQDVQEILSQRSIYPQYTETQEGVAAVRYPSCLACTGTESTYTHTYILFKSEMMSSFYPVQINIGKGHNTCHQLQKHTLWVAVSVLLRGTSRVPMFTAEDGVGVRLLSSSSAHHKYYNGLLLKLCHTFHLFFLFGTLELNMFTQVPRFNECIRSSWCEDAVGVGARESSAPPPEPLSPQGGWCWA